MRRRNSGFVLLTALAVLASLVTLSTVLITRAMTESLAARNYVQKNQAFHAAEAGIDVAAAEFIAGGEDGLPGSFSSNTDKWDQGPGDGTGAPCVTGLPCLKRISLGGATYTATIDDIASGQPIISSVGVASAASETVVAQFQQADNFLDYAWFVNGNARLANGRALTFEGGTGRIHVQGDLMLEGGNSGTVAGREAKAITVKAGEINVYGAFGRTAGTPATEAPVYISKYNPGTLQWDKKNLPTTNPYRSTDSPPDYLNWLTGINNPADPLDDHLDAFGSRIDYTGFLKEINTGAISQASLLTGDKEDIDKFVLSFAPASHHDIAIVDADDLGSLLCSGAFTKKSFANSSIVQKVTLVEIDAELLTGCRGVPTTVYSAVPVRLAHGELLGADLTVASPQAIYLKGNFNTVNPKVAAIVTGNRSYHLSNVFKDFQGFIPKGVKPTVADAIAAYGASQATFVHDYGDPAIQNTTIPPQVNWLPTLAETTTQRVAIVSPLAGASEHAITGHDHTMERWDGVVLRQEGAFINLKDLNPALLADGITPQDKRNPKLDDPNITIPPNREFAYDQNLTGKSAPGFTGGGKPRLLIWRQP